MKHKAAVVLKYGGLCLSCLMILAGVFVVSIVLEGGKLADTVQTVQDFYNPQPVCSFSDRSFCKTEQAFRKMVATADVSDILANQEYISLTCTTPAEQSACAGIADNFTVQVFSVDEGNAAQILTRNQYVAYFSSYFATNGPFSLAYDKPIKNGAAITFMNKAKTEAYTLKFQKTDTDWKLITSQVSSV